MRSSQPRVCLLAIGLAVLTAAASTSGSGRGSGMVLAADPSAPAAPVPVVVDLTLSAADALISDAERRVIDLPEPLGEVAVDDVIGGTYAAAEALPLAEWDIGALAASLGTDPRAAFEFVRDSIRFDPYPGVLRGASGTLAARSGNASDRALLLHDLLAAMGIGSRFAFGDLAPEAAAVLVDHAFDRAVSPLSDAGDLRLASLDGTAIEQRSRRDYALLRDALGDRFAAMAPASIQGVLMDVVHHTWVQVEQGDTWVDYDPSLNDAQPGTALAVVARTSDAMPPEEHQSVTVRVIAETLHGEEVWDEMLLERRLDADMAANTATFLYFQPHVEDADPGLLGTVDAATSWVPVLLVDAEAQQGDPFPIGNGDGGDDGGGFGDFGGFRRWRRRSGTDPAQPAALGHQRGPQGRSQGSPPGRSSTGCPARGSQGR